MTLNEIKAAAAGYLEHEVEDLTVNGVDLGLIALNQVRLNAEMVNNFEFSRKLLTLVVDGVVGGSLDVAVEMGTTTIWEVKSVVDVGLFNASTGDLLPVEWTTVAESLSRQREENPFAMPRYPTDGEAVSGPWGARRFLFSGNKVYFYSKVAGETFSVGIEAYTFHGDWVDDDLRGTAPSTDPWLTKGHQYLLWGTVENLNNLFKHFVFRQEGNLPPPKDMKEAGLAALINWDIFKYEQSRRRGR